MQGTRHASAGAGAGKAVLLGMLLLVCAWAARAEAANCGTQPGWPVKPEAGAIATYGIAAPETVSTAGWQVAQTFTSVPAGAQRTADDMAICVPVQVTLTSLGQKVDALVRPDLHAWTPVAGNNAHFDVTVEEFVDCAQAVPGASQSAASQQVDHTCTGQGTGPNNEPVVSGPDGHPGFWKDIGTHQVTDMQATSGASPHADSVLLYVPAELTDVTAWVRVRAHYREGDSRLGSGAVTWQKGAGPDYCAADSMLIYQTKHGHTTPVCKSRQKEVVHDKHGNHYEYVYTAPRRTIHPDSGAFESDVPSNPFHMVVTPVALVQLKAVPYAIAYMPPGNLGKTRLMNSITAGTNYAVGTTAGSSNATGDVAGTCDSTSVGFSLSLFLFGGGISESDLQCSQTNSVDGATQNTANVGAAYQNESNDAGAEIADPGYVPGDYAKEAFWFDTFTLALNQAAAVYDDKGKSVTRFLPVNGYPDWAYMPVIQLAACAYGGSIPGVDNVCKAGVTPDHKDVILTAQEAESILWLDPFFPAGQSAMPGWPASRFTRLTEMGGAGTVNCPVGITCLLQASNAQGISGTQQFQATTYTTVTVTDTNKETQGWTLSMGYSGSVDVGDVPVKAGASDSLGGSTSDIQGTVTSNGAALGYFANTAVSAGRTITFRVTPADKAHAIVATVDASNSSCTGYPDPIFVYPYQDNVYGGLMLRDPCAPMPIWLRAPIPLHVKIAAAPDVRPQLRDALRVLVRKAPPAPGRAAGPAAPVTELETKFSAELDRAIASNPQTAAYINSLPHRCAGPKCLLPRREVTPVRPIEVPQDRVR